VEQQSQSKKARRTVKIKRQLVKAAGKDTWGSKYGKNGTAESAERKANTKTKNGEEKRERCEGFRIYYDKENNVVTSEDFEQGASLQAGLCPSSKVRGRRRRGEGDKKGVYHYTKELVKGRQLISKNFLHRGGSIIHMYIEGWVKEGSALVTG